MIWTKKHMIQKTYYGNRLIEKRYIYAPELRKVDDGIAILKRHDYQQRGKRSRSLKMYTIKNSI